MRRRDILKAAAAVPAAMLIGCDDGKPKKPEEPAKAEKPSPPKPPEMKPPAAVKKAGTCLLCFKCGQIKGSALCCKADAEKCPMCGLHKGSPGCCRIKGATADVCLCTYCGQIKGSDKCCKPGTEKCTNCGLDKGSPGCCRIKREEKPAMM